MKKILILINAALLALVVTFTVSNVLAKEGEKHEKNEAKASIRPEGKVKRADLPALAKISLDEALKAARAAIQGSVVEAELEIDDGDLVYVFAIVGADKQVSEVKIDAGNGKVLDIDKD